MKIVVMLSRVPWPLEKGDKLRAYHQVAQLSKRHSITLCCLSDEPVHPEAHNELSKVADRVEIFRLSKAGIYANLIRGFFSSKPYQVLYFYQNSIRKKVEKVIAEVQPDHIYCQLIRAAEYVKNELTIPKTIDYMDAFSKGMERRIVNEKGALRPFVKSEYRRLLAYENIIFEYFDHKTIISEQDRDLIYHSDRLEIAVIPNGVDAAYFAPRETEKEYDVVFVGNMSYAPNVQAAQFLAEEIIPLLAQNKPECKVLIAGANPAPAVKALSNAQVEISGWVDDIRDCYAKARVFIAPMHIGTGLQNKLLEAMAMEIPCITTPLANNALGGTDGENVLIAHTAAECAAAIQRLLNDGDLAAQLATNGRRYVEKRYTWEGTVQQLEGLFSK